MDNIHLNMERVWRLCQQCAKNVYRSKPPTPSYAFNVAQFLFEIAAQESSLRWERQRTPAFDGPVGGFSKWQMEKGFIASAQDYIRRNPQLAVHTTDFVFADPNCPPSYLTSLPLDTLLVALRFNDNDALGVALCRVGILQWPELIPPSVDARAILWKKRYNTHLGSGTEAQYIYHAEQFCHPITKKGM